MISRRIQHDLFTPVVDALFKNGSRYNLLNSSILELFKYIHDENIKVLLEHTQEQFGERLKDIKYTDIFEKIQTKVQQEGEEQVKTIFIDFGCVVFELERA